ncbi:MAG: helix-turn-helix domain-containing protein [Planctomycetes bacterium]|nr:helix-turn-helix domain-containing protein [Planctomycetota bacterium]
MATECVKPNESLLVDAKGVCTLLGIGLSCLYAMDRSGELGPMGIRLRRRRLWPREELADWVKAGCPRREIWVERKNS